MSDTLVLNSSGEPISIIPLSIISWKEAIKLVYLQKVTVLECYDYWVVHSPSTAMAVPAIIMTKKFMNSATKIRFTKQNILYRDDFTCQYCSEQFEPNELTLDHVKPKSMGGRKTWDNTVLACGPCNWSRGHNHHIKPKNMPYKPTYYQLVNARKRYPIYLKHPAWNNYLKFPPELVLKDRPKHHEGHFEVDCETL